MQQQHLLPELQSYLHQLATIGSEVDDVIANITEQQLNWRPGPGQWSVGECVDHLTVTGTRLLERIEPAIAQARSIGNLAEGPFRYGPMNRWFVRTLDEGAGRNIKTFPIYAPAATNSREQVAMGFREFHQRLAAAIRSANGIDLKRTKVRSPAMPLLNLSVGAWFAATLAHERRHLAQARRVMREGRFGATSE
ncbi:MAG: DinB family protein [Armatimonadetes bacterium]|nr:DinB family protein [Armatimonadota bacterium]